MRALLLLLLFFLLFPLLPLPSGSANANSQQNRQKNRLLPLELLFEKSCKKLFSSAGDQKWDGGCQCTSPRPGGPKGGVKCCCLGQWTSSITSGILGKASFGTIGSIFLFDVPLAQIGPTSLAHFPNLIEFFLDSAPLLERVDSRAFSPLRLLRKIRVSNCPRLTQWNGTMLRDSPRLQSLIVQNNGLRELPQLEMRSAENVLPMERIDFSGNCLSRIPSGAMRNVAAKSVLFTRNGLCLRSVEANAFRGCKFVSLQLAANPLLSDLSSDCFAGLLHLERLDLSGTAIRRLPHSGLRSLRRLTLQSVSSLKQLPPVLAFPNLVQAEFTYSHHCCFFKHASRDFYSRKWKGDGGILEMNFREIQRRVCQKGDISADRIMTRQRRHVFAHRSDDTLFFKELAEWYKNIDLQPMRSQRNEDDPTNQTLNADFSRIEPEPFTDDQLGKGFPLRNCDRTAAVDSFFLNITCSPQPDALNPCEDIISNWPLRAVIWLMWLGAIFGNLAVWAVICAVWQRKMRMHYLFMLNLSFADFLTGVYLSMLAFVDLHTADEYYNYAVEWQTGAGCALAGFLSVFASQLSIFSMLMIALEIYYNSRFAFYGRRLGAVWATGALLLGYAYSLAMASFPLLGISSYQHSSICLPLRMENSLDKLYLLTGLSLSGFAFAAMVLLYGLLNCMVRQSSVNSSASRADEDKQIVRRTLALIGTDMLCWVPTLFFGLTAALGRPLITLSAAKWCLVLFYPINSCANPLLYVFLTRTWSDAKRKAGPLLRRSLTSAGRMPRGTISANKMERFYSSEPSRACLYARPMSNRTDQPNDGINEAPMTRSKTIHCCEGEAPRKQLLRDIFPPSDQQQKDILEEGHQSRNASCEEKRQKEKSLRRKSSPATERESFQSSIRQFPSSADSFLLSAIRRKSFLPRPKISAPPQMSDISESSTASIGSWPQHKEGVGRKDGLPIGRTKEERRILVMAVAGEQQQEREGEARAHKRERRESVGGSSAGGDSGRGDSLSSWPKSVRHSVVSLCWEHNDGIIGQAVRQQPT